VGQHKRHYAPSNRDQGAGEWPNRAVQRSLGRIDFPTRSERYTLQRWQKAGFAPLPISDLTPALLAQWRDEQLDQKAAPGTVRNALASLSAVIRHAALEWGFEDLQNPVMKIKRPAPSKGRTRRLLPGELEAIRQATESPWLVPIVDLAVETAMRQGELASLKWEHVDLDGRTAYLPSTKSGDARTVPLSFGAIAVLQKLRTTRYASSPSRTAFAVVLWSISLFPASKWWRR